MNFFTSSFSKWRLWYDRVRAQGTKCFQIWWKCTQRELLKDAVSKETSVCFISKELNIHSPHAWSSPSTGIRETGCLLRNWGVEQGRARSALGIVSLSVRLSCGWKSRIMADYKPHFYVSHAEVQREAVLPTSSSVDWRSQNSCTSTSCCVCIQPMGRGTLLTCCS